MIDTIDDARIHVAAAIDATVKNERIFAVDDPTDWEEVIQVIREMLPERQLPTPHFDAPAERSVIDNAIGGKLLSKWWGISGYKGLKRTVHEQLEMFEANPY